MHSTTPGDGGSATREAYAARRWAQLVASLRGDVDEIVDTFLERVATIPPYERGRVPLALVRSDARDSIEHLVDRLEGRVAGERPGVDDIAERVGVDRARREVPLDALMSAVRLDVEVLWTRLRSFVQDEDLPVVVDRVQLIWQVVEEYCRDVQRAYLREQGLMAREEDFERGAVVGRLLDGPVDDRIVEQVASALGAGADEPVLVLASPADRRDGLWSLFRELLGQRRRPHWHPVGDDVLLLLPLPDGDSVDREMRRLRTARPELCCAMSPFAACIADLPAAVQVAQQLCRALPRDQGGLLEVRDLWPQLVGRGLGAAGPALRRAVLSPLDALPEPDRERLDETCAAYLRTGSVAATARACYCHRNTVLNRLARVRELTGCDVTVPEQAALLQLAMAVPAQPLASR